MITLAVGKKMLCAGCERPILDRFLLNVLDRAWHSTCVQCSDCASPLTDKCFSREGKLYCKDDFFRRFGTKCGGCLQGISPNDLVRRARNKVFHLKCFTCLVCRKQLSTGEELYVLDESKFICKDDFLNSKCANGSEDEMELDSQSLMDKFDDHLSDKGSDYGDCDSRDSSLPPAAPLNLGTPVSGPVRLDAAAPTMLDTSGDALQLLKTPDSQAEKNNNDVQQQQLGDNNNKENTKSASDAGEEKDLSDEEEGDDKKKTAGTKRRGPRTTIKAKQLEVLKAAFAATPKPTRHIREQLAAETGLNMRVIQVWFQNRRSKERRMKQLSQLGAARRGFFRSPRRMRGLGPEEGDFVGHGFAYFDNGEYYPTPFPGAPYPGEFYPGQDPQNPINFPPMPPTSGPQGTPPMDPQTGVPVMPGHDGASYPVMQHDMLQAPQPNPQSNSPEPGLPALHQSMEPYMRGAGGPGPFPMHPDQISQQPPQPPQPTETW